MAELKTLRFELGVNRPDRIKKEYIRGTAKVSRQSLGGEIAEKLLSVLGEGC